MTIEDVSKDIQQWDNNLTVACHSGGMGWDAISFDSRAPFIVICGTLTAQ